MRPSRMQMFNLIAKLSEDITFKGGINRVGNAYFINYKDKRRIIAQRAVNRAKSVILI